MAKDILNAAHYLFNSGYQYSEGGKGQTITYIKNGKTITEKLTDCSWLVYSSVKAAGYDVNYLSTRQIMESNGTLTSHTRSHAC